MPDGSWVMIMLGGGDTEPHPKNQVFITRSSDEGKTWGPMQPLDFGFPREGNTGAVVPSELMVRAGRATLFFGTHNGQFAGWKHWMVDSDDSGRSWSKPRPVPGRLHDRTFIRNHIVTRDGRILLPFQHYVNAPSNRNPRNGVIMSADGGKTWTEHGNIRLSLDDSYRGWAENNIVEMRDGRIAMIIRADKLGGVLYYAESTDGGRTWPELAVKTSIPNSGSKATLYALGGDAFALLHNPNPTARSPLALWVSFDGMKTWPYRRVLRGDLVGAAAPPPPGGPNPGEGGRFNYPDGFVSADKRWLHFAFDYGRYQAIYVGARLPPTTWPLNGVDDSLIVRGGNATTAAGALGQSLVLDGGSLVELKDSANLNGSAFTVSLWFNPYDLAGGQQMLVGKNRYSLGERQWGLTIEPDGKLKAYLRQSSWSTIPCNEPLVAGKWHLATLAVNAQKASLYLNGKLVGEVLLNSPIAATPAPITLGGIWDAGAVNQAFHGAVDEFSFQPEALSAQAIATSYQPVSVTHELPQLWTHLWDATQTLPKAADLSQVKDAKFYVLGKLREDGAKFTLGVGLAWHKGKLYASYGFSTSEQENTAHEEAHVRVSEDGGKTWGQPVAIDAGAGNLGVSHGVFLSHGGRLWAFMGAFYDNFNGPTSRTHTRGYVLNETSGKWETQGVVLDQGFWPMQEPQQMADGNWIMSGVRISFGLGVVGHLPAVAISQGDDFTKWKMVVIHTDSSVGTTNLWGESTVIVEPTKITNIARRSGGRVRGDALVSISKDHGRTWTPAAPSNLPMATQKPYAGTLSTGQRYLIGTITADTDGRRSPLTIAVSKPGESLFSRVFLIRTSVFDGTPGVSAQDADFSYPYAVERNGQLYIGYTDKEHIYNELAVIPVSSLEMLPGKK
jgi:hypothetical protein